MEDIKDRGDVNSLVLSFYDKVRKDDFIGPIFNKIIPEDHWAEHLEKLTDFWETNLFGVPKFKGNPMRAHINADKKENYTISQEHFGRWLEIWFLTLDELFQGERSDLAKHRARNMSTGLFLRMCEHKPK
ncbi:MAG: group III truncated hemoglobin [Flavobacteriaceae bacterium]|nr:group III truncated hemoglobin [Flavobacteriaceae bacterium]